MIDGRASYSLSSYQKLTESWLISLHEDSFCHLTQTVIYGVVRPTAPLLSLVHHSKKV
jgi:hypothetical protein